MAVLKYKKNGVWYEVNAGSSAGVADNQQTEITIASIIDALSVPVLAPKATWYKGNTAKADITAIHVVNKYTATGSEVESWAADEAGVGTIMCYVNGTELTICCDRARGIALNPNSDNALSWFTNATVFTGQEFLKMERVSYAYQMCMGSAFTELGDPSWNFARIYSFAFAFCSMPNLTSIDLGKSTLASLDSAQAMFSGDAALKYFIAPELRMDNTRVTMAMFYGCSSLESIDLGESTFDGTVPASNMFNGCTSLVSVGMPMATFEAVTDASGMFRNCTSLENIAWKATFAHATDISRMFHKCSALKTIDLSRANLSNVTTCNGMFASVDWSTAETGMHIEKIIGIETLNLSNCADFASMFYGCHHLTELDLSLWNVSKGTNFSHMFADMSGLTKLTLDDGKGNAWNPISAVTFNCMFNDNMTEELDISCFASAKAMSLCQMFERFAGTIVGYDKLDTSETTEMAQMFISTNMEVLDLSGYDTRKVSGSVKSGDTQSEAGFTDMLTSANYLKEIRLGVNFDTRGDGTLSEAQAFVLPTPNSAYIPGADGFWYEEDGTQYDPALPPNPAVLGRAITLYAVKP